MTDELRAEFLLDGRIWLYPGLISICDDLIVSVTDWQHTVTMMIPDALVLQIRNQDFAHMPSYTLYRDLHFAVATTSGG